MDGIAARITDYSHYQESAGTGRCHGGNGIIRKCQTTTNTKMSL